MGVSNLYGSYAKKAVTDKKPSNIKGLFIDLNAIIHGIAAEVTMGRKSGNDPKKDIQIINRVLEKIAELLRDFNPSDIFYIAVDGLPPMAKIVHQIGGRSKSAGSVGGFDTVAISPGTDFMFDLCGKIASKVRSREYNHGSDREVIFSPHTMVGEGEHKISRYMNSVPNNGPNIIVSPDADMVFISLISKCSNIYLYREDKRKHGKGRDARITIHKKFVDIEKLKSEIPHSRYNDMTFLGTIIGNDFIPPCPSLMNVAETVERINLAIKVVDPIVTMYEDSSGDRNFTIDNYNFLIAMAILTDDYITEIDAYRDEREELLESEDDPDLIQRYKEQIRLIDEFTKEEKINGEYVAINRESEISRIIRRHFDERVIGFEGLKYLREKRELTEEEIEDFSISWVDGELNDVNEDLYLKLLDSLGKDKGFSLKAEDEENINEQYVLGMYWTLRYYITAGDVNELWYYSYTRAPLGVRIIDTIRKFVDFDHMVALPNMHTEMNILHQLAYIIPINSRAVLPSILQEAVFGDDSYIRPYKEMEFTVNTEGRDKSNKYTDKSYTYKNRVVVAPLEIIHSVVSNIRDSDVRHYLPSGLVKPNDKGAKSIMSNTAKLAGKQKSVKRPKKIIGEEELNERGFVRIDKKIRVNTSLSKGKIKAPSSGRDLQYVKDEKKKLDKLKRLKKKSEKKKSKVKIVEDSSTDEVKTPKDDSSTDEVKTPKDDSSTDEVKTPKDDSSTDEVKTPKDDSSTDEVKTPKDDSSEEMSEDDIIASMMG